MTVHEARSLAYGAVIDAWLEDPYRDGASIVDRAYALLGSNADAYRFVPGIVLRVSERDS